MSEQLAMPEGDAPAAHPIHLVITDDLERNRLTVFGYVAQVVAFLAWLYALFAGKLHPGLRDVLAYWLRYNAQAFGYICLLTQRYPSFSDE